LTTLFTLGFCLVIVGLFVDFWRRRGSVPAGSAILTMVGIAGTFFGIAIGLAHFNTADIGTSTTRLIEGMKIAVWASFAGVLTAVVLKYRDALVAAKNLESNTGDETSPSDEIAALRELIGTSEHTSLLYRAFHSTERQGTR
jgi:membrane associated rhomboid family serine protease